MIASRSRIPDVECSSQQQWPTLRSCQRWLESHCRTPTPLLFQNFWIRVRCFSDLRIRPLFKIRQSLTQQWAMTAIETTPAAAENNKWLWVRFFKKLWFRIRRKAQNPAGVESGSVATSGPYALRRNEFTKAWKKRGSYRRTHEPECDSYKNWCVAPGSQTLGPREQFLWPAADFEFSNKVIISFTVLCFYKQS